MSLGSVDFLPTTQTDKDVKHYEELTGQRAKRIYYRPERFRFNDVFKQGVPSLLINEARVKPLDLSINGLSYLATHQEDTALPEVGTHLPIVCLYAGQTLYRGVGRVVRHEQQGNHVKTALYLVEGPFNLKEVVDLYSISTLKLKTEQHVKNVLTLVPQQYKELCSDVLYMLSSYEDLLNKYETKARADGVFTVENEDRILDSCEETLMPVWHDLWEQGNALTIPHMTDPIVRSAIKEYTEKTLTPEFIKCAGWRRCYEKPLGYPGDYKIMQNLYRYQREGNSTYEKLLHCLGLDLGAFLRYRMFMMRSIIADVVSTRAEEGRGDAVRISNIGSGAAHEVYEYLNAYTPEMPITFTLLDQDDRPLAEAYKNAYTSGLKSPHPVDIQVLNTSFTELMRPESALGGLPQQDIVYSLGIMDYLVQKRAKRFVHSLYERVAPGGTLVVANMALNKRCPLWALEFIFDWTLQYRTEQEMLDLVEGLDVTDVSVTPDESGNIFLLRATKR